MLDESLFFVLFAIFFVFAIVMVIYGHFKEKERRANIHMKAQKLGLEYHEKDPFAISKEFSYLNTLKMGSNRYAFNVMNGRYQGHKILFFDYHYETYSKDRDGNEQTDHHYFSAGILKLSRSFPELIAKPEGLFHKLGQAFGFDDIDLDNLEFSRKYLVKSKDKKFAYDIFHPRMMELFLRLGRLSLEIERDTMILTFGRVIKPEILQSQLDQLVEIREQMPKYIFKD